MKKKIIGTLVLGVALASQASWTLLDNFDSYDNANPLSSVASGDIWNSEWYGTANSTIEDTDQGQSLVTYGGAAWRGADRDLSGTGAAVLVDETQTFFYQLKVHSEWAGVNWDFMMGLAPDVSNIDQNNAWQDFSAMPYVAGSPNPTPAVQADGATAGASGALTQDVWYNLWLVVDNDAIDPTFDMYMSTGTDDGTLILQDGDWRNHAANQDLNAIGFMAAGWDQTSYTIDNIYYADGVVDTTYAIPEPATIGLIAVMGGGMLFIRRRFMI